MSLAARQPFSPTDPALPPDPVLPSTNGGESHPPEPPRARKPGVRAMKGRRPRRGRPSKVALVCAGGGITGAVYEMGCLRALEEILDRSVLDFDVYVGVSGGAFVSALVAGGVSPREMYDEVWARRPLGISEGTLFRLGLGDLVRRTAQAPRVVLEAVMKNLRDDDRNVSDLAFSLLEVLPPGLLSNSGVQEYIQKVLAMRGRRDSFDDLVRELYLVAVDLDSGEAVAFGEKGYRDVPISQAVQASTALPGLYRPVRIKGRDYVDGGVKKTAHINLAIQRGADLVICINPIVPLLNDTKADGALGGHLSNKGVSYVIDQAMRIMLHGRMQYGMERYELEHPEVDILLIEPTRDDMRMFTYNIMRYSARRVVAEHGYRSVIKGFQRSGSRYRRLLERHGIGVTDPRKAPALPPPHPYRTPVGRSLAGSLDLLESKLRKA
jgi:NTE family protein